MVSSSYQLIFTNSFYSKYASFQTEKSDSILQPRTQNMLLWRRWRLWRSSIFRQRESFKLAVCHPEQVLSLKQSERERQQRAVLPLRVLQAALQESSLSNAPGKASGLQIPVRSKVVSTTPNPISSVFLTGCFLILWAQMYVTGSLPTLYRKPESQAQSL